MPKVNTRVIVKAEGRGNREASELLKKILEKFDFDTFESLCAEGRDLVEIAADMVGVEKGNFIPEAEIEVGFDCIQVQLPDSCFVKEDFNVELKVTHNPSGRVFNFKPCVSSVTRVGAGSAWQ